MDDHQLRVTVAAMKLLLGRLWALTYSQMKLDPALIPGVHKTLLETWGKYPLVKSNDPAISDVMSDDVLRELETFLQGVEKDFARMKSDPR